MGEPANTWRAPVLRPQAWRDGDELVFRIGAPLPSICVFCGATAVATIFGGIETRNSFSGLKVFNTRLPVCENDRRRHHRVVTFGYTKIAALFVGIFLLAAIPGAAEFVGKTLLPFFAGSFDGMRPAVGAVVLALVVLVVRSLVRRLPWVRAVRPRPVMLRYGYSRDGYVWLRDADPRCLEQLPPVAPGR